MTARVALDFEHIAVNMPGVPVKSDGPIIARQVNNEPKQSVT